MQWQTPSPASHQGMSMLLPQAQSRSTIQPSPRPSMPAQTPPKPAATPPLCRRLSWGRYSSSATPVPPPPLGPLIPDLHCLSRLSTPRREGDRKANGQLCNLALHEAGHYQATTGGGAAQRSTSPTSMLEATPLATIDTSSATGWPDSASQ